MTTVDTDSKSISTKKYINSITNNQKISEDIYITAPFTFIKIK